jgi:5-methyltetrahydrofolate--homocysteine methyltransferase
MFFIYLPFVIMKVGYCKGNDCLSLDNLANAVCDADIDRTLKLCNDLLNEEITPNTILVDGLTKGLTLLGKLWEEGDAFLADVLCAIDAFYEGLAIIEPHLKGDKSVPLGTIIIGTVAGDIHSVGKNIVATLFMLNGFEVKDLGEDVSPEQFVKAIQAEHVDILALSCLVSTSLPAMTATIQRLQEQGLRKDIKVMVGGPPVTPEFVDKIGADLYAQDAFEAFKVAKGALTS